MVLSNDEINHIAAEAAFVAILPPKPGETFVWLNQYQVEQTARKVPSWYGFDLSSHAQNIFCSCSKSHSSQAKKGPISDNKFYGICEDDKEEKKKRN